MISRVKSVLHSETRKRLASNFFSLALIQGANYLVPILILPYIVRIIGPEKFGLLTYAQTFVYYFTMIINYGFDYTATREVSLNRDDHRKVAYIFSSVFFSKIVLFLMATIIFAVAILSVEQFNKNAEIYWITYLINVGFVFFPSWFYQGIEKLTNLAVFNFLSKLLFAVMVVVMIRQEGDYYFYALSTSIAQVIAGVAAFYYGLRIFRIDVMRISLQHMKDVLKEGVPVFLSNIAISLYTTTNLIILGFFTTETEYGYFSAALKIALTTQTLVILPLGMTLFPHIGKKMQQSETEGVNLIVRYAKFISAAMLLLGVIMFIFAELLISILFGDQFLPGAFYLRIMAFMPLVSGINNLVSVQGLLNLKMDKAFFLATIVTFAFSLALIFVLVPKYEGTGTAIIILLSELCMTVLAGIALFRRKFSEG